MATWQMGPTHPFGEEVPRLPLYPDPLVRVIAQIRFSPVLSVQDQGFIAPFQEALRVVYPLAEKDMQQQFAPGPHGALQISESVVWRFSDLGKAWQVSLSETFVALDCSNYTDRGDFIGRLRQLLEAAEAHVRPVLVTRVGVRYINRLVGQDEVGNLSNYVRPELLGLAKADLATGRLMNQMTQAEFEVDGVTLRGRWGTLPADVSHEGSLDPVPEPSWVLDLDAFSGDTSPFDAGCAIEEAERFAAMVYCFFRWSMSDEFLISRGAKV